MSRTIYKSVYGYCPEQDHDVRIDVTFVEVPVVGCTVRQYKKTGYSCDYCDEHDCRAAGDRGLDCPLFRQAEP